MANISVIKATTLYLTIQEIKILLEDGSIYTINVADKVFFTVKDRDKKTLLQKRMPGDIELIGGNLLIKIYPEDTDGLPCLAYPYDCKIDLQGLGRDIYTLVSGNLEVLPTVTHLIDTR